jgi:hypothetical protein
VAIHEGGLSFWPGLPLAVISCFVTAWVGLRRCEYRRLPRVATLVNTAAWLVMRNEGG